MTYDDKSFFLSYLCFMCWSEGKTWNIVESGVKHPNPESKTWNIVESGVKHPNPNPESKTQVGHICTFV